MSVKVLELAADMTYCHFHFYLRREALRRYRNCRFFFLNQKRTTTTPHMWCGDSIEHRTWTSVGPYKPQQQLQLGQGLKGRIGRIHSELRGILCDNKMTQLFMSISYFITSLHFRIVRALDALVLR